MKAIDYLKRTEGPMAPSEDVEMAVRLHDSCASCRGSGGDGFYPENPCPDCGLTVADSYGLESIPRPKTIIGVLASPRNVGKKRQ